MMMGDVESLPLGDDDVESISLIGSNIMGEQTVAVLFTEP